MPCAKQPNTLAVTRSTTVFYKKRGGPSGLSDATGVHATVSRTLLGKKFHVGGINEWGRKEERIENAHLAISNHERKPFVIVFIVCESYLLLYYVNAFLL